MYKIVNGIDNVDVRTLFSFAPSRYVTRNFEGKIFVPQVSTSKGLFSFSHRVIAPWNSLPAKTKFAKTVNDFKNQILR